VSLAPSHTEILFELGLEKEIVGVTTYCNYPEPAKRKEKVGDYLSPNVEKIVSLKPNYVFCLTENPYISKLKKLGVTVVAKNPQSVPAIRETIEYFGEITGTEKRAAAIIKEIDSVLKGISAEKNKKTNESVYVEIYYPPAWSCSDSSIIGEAVGMLGMENIFSNVNRDYFQVSEEEIILKNPQVFLILSGVKNVHKRRGYVGIDAVKRKRVIYWDDRDLLTRPTPRLIRTLPLLKNKIYSEK